MDKLDQRKQRKKGPESEKLWWDELKRLSDNDDVVGFYRLYSEYLEWNNIYSNSRKAIHKMAVKVVEILNHDTKV